MADNSQNNIQIDTLDIDGLSIRVALHGPAGSGVPLLLFNGIGANLELFFPLMRALPQLRTIIFDAPGIGGSSMPLIPMRFKGLTRLSRKIITQFGYDVVDVLGVSWGGALAQEFAHRQARHCRRLILAATSPGAVMVPGRLSVLLKLASPKRYLLADYLKLHASEIYGGKLRSDDTLIDGFIDLLKPSKTQRGYYGQLYAATAWTSIHWLHEITQPTLILAGKDDPIVPTVNAKLLHLRIPDSRLVLVDCGHLFLFTMTKDIAPIILKFLTDDNPV